MNVCTPNISWHGCDPVYSCAINPIDCKRLATAGMRGKLSFRLQISFHCNFVSGSIYLWDIEFPTPQQPTISFISSLTGAHLESVNCIRWNSKGTHLASASDDSNIFIWTKAPTMTTDSNITVLTKTNQQSTTALTTNDNDNVLGWDKDIPESKERWLKSLPYKCHLEPVLDLAWSRDDQLLVSGSVDKKVIVVCEVYLIYSYNHIFLL
jgi:WD40 repeat protein